MKPKTFSSYKTDLKKAELMHGSEPLHEIVRQNLLNAHIVMTESFGVHMAHHATTALIRALTWAEGQSEWKHHIPHYTEYHNLGLKKGSARLRVGLPKEMATLLVAFDNPDLLYDQIGTNQSERALKPNPFLGDALIRMLWSCARVHDSLKMTPKSYYERQSTIAMGKDGTDSIEVKNWLTWKPQKTNRAGDPPAIVTVPVIGIHQDRFTQMILRHKNLVNITSKSNPEFIPLALDPESGKPYARKSEKTGVHYHREFSDAWNAHRDLAGEIVPSIIGRGNDRYGDPWTPFLAQDCRDTAVTRLAHGGLSLLQISAWHGSSPEVLAKLVKHYIHLTPEMADRGTDQMIKTIAAAGITV